LRISSDWYKCGDEDDLVAGAWGGELRSGVIKRLRVQFPFPI